MNDWADREMVAWNRLIKAWFAKDKATEAFKSAVAEFQEASEDIMLLAPPHGTWSIEEEVMVHVSETEDVFHVTFDLNKMELVSMNLLQEILVIGDDTYDEDLGRV